MQTQVAKEKIPLVHRKRAAPKNCNDYGLGIHCVRTTLQRPRIHNDHDEIRRKANARVYANNGEMTDSIRNVLHREMIRILL